MPQSKFEQMTEFMDRTHTMYDLYPEAAVEISATLELVDEHPHLARVGHELFQIIATNQESGLAISPADMN